MLKGKLVSAASVTKVAFNSAQPLATESPVTPKSYLETPLPVLVRLPRMSKLPPGSVVPAGSSSVIVAERTSPALLSAEALSEAPPAAVRVTVSSSPYAAPVGTPWVTVTNATWPMVSASELLDADEDQLPPVEIAKVSAPLPVFCTWKTWLVELSGAPSCVPVTAVTVTS